MRRQATQLVITITALLALAITKTANAQTVVSTARVEDWFYSRLIWAALLAAMMGAVIGAFHLSRLRTRPTELQVNGQARRKFWLWSAILAVAGAVLLLIDIWMLYSFDSVSLNFIDALTQVWFNYRTILILLAAFICFYITVALTTRFVRNSRCPYAFIPGPRGK